MLEGTPENTLPVHKVPRYPSAPLMEPNRDEASLVPSQGKHLNKCHLPRSRSRGPRLVDKASKLEFLSERSHPKGCCQKSCPFGSLSYASRRNFGVSPARRHPGLCRSRTRT